MKENAKKIINNARAFPLRLIVFVEKFLYRKLKIILGANARVFFFFIFERRKT